MATKYDYITIAPVTPKGKWTICQRRIGTRDRYAPVAEARTQGAADGIVDALNLMQGEVKKLEVPAQRLLEQVREEVTKQRKLHSEYHSKCVGLEHQLREAKRETDRVAQERNIAQGKLQVAEARIRDLDERNTVQGETIGRLTAELETLKKKEPA